MRYLYLKYVLPAGPISTSIYKEVPHLTSKLCMHGQIISIQYRSKSGKKNGRLYGHLRSAASS